MHVWRIPLPFFGAFVAATTLVLVWVGVASLRRRTDSVVVRGILLTVALVAAMLSPYLVQAITRDELARMAELGVHIRYAPYLFLTPALLVAVLFGISHVAFPPGVVKSAYRWHLKFWLSALGFGLLNIVNWCSPGWCERFGFPLPYSWWSDAMITMNGQNLTAGSSVIALLANVAAFLFLVNVLALSYRREARNQNAHSSTSRTHWRGTAP